MQHAEMQLKHTENLAPDFYTPPNFHTPVES